MIPVLVVHCINEIEKRGLREVRISLHKLTHIHTHTLKASKRVITPFSSFLFNTQSCQIALVTAIPCAYPCPTTHCQIDGDRSFKSSGPSGTFWISPVSISKD